MSNYEAYLLSFFPFFLINRMQHFPDDMPFHRHVTVHMFCQDINQVLHCNRAFDLFIQTIN